MKRRAFLKSMVGAVAAVVAAPFAAKAIAPSVQEYDWKTFPTSTTIAKGKTLRFRRYRKFSEVAKPLAEGVTPTQISLYSDRFYVSADELKKYWFESLEIAGKR